MKIETIESFLKDAGYAYERQDGEHTSRFWFKDRGLVLWTLGDDAQPMLLTLNAQFDLSGCEITHTNLEKIVREIEDRTYVLKLHASPPNEGPYAVVMAEVYEGNLDSVSGVFWELIDAIRAAGAEVKQRVEEHVAAASDSTPITESIDTFEAAVRDGCFLEHDASEIIEKMRTSLALVWTESGTGSAFCIASTPTESFFITNAHVVEEFPAITLYRQHPAYQKLAGTVVAKGDVKNLDLAIVSVPVGDLPFVALSDRAPVVDTPIALAGYARVQLLAAKQTGEIVAAVHLGTVTCVKHDETCVLHDATSRPGNSGGPLFDPKSGLVYGVECYGWESEEVSAAVGTSAIRQFLSDVPGLTNLLPANRKPAKKRAIAV